jgi:ornithine cyclodeaminase/alanine dehydrogenase-like protein (mu-crystallin family)
MSSSWGPTSLISGEQIKRHVGVADAHAVTEEVLKGLARGRVEMPAKVTMELLPRYGMQAWNTAMPAYIESLNASGFKWVGGFAENREKHGLPFLIATILVQDSVTGYPLAIMEGVHITNLRTGAVAAVAVQHYARKEPHRLAFVGTGVQARFALAAIRDVATVTEVRAYDIDKDAAQRFRDDSSSAHGMSVTVCHTAQEAVSGADVVITATPSTTPIVRRAWLEPGVTAISIGSQGQEFDDEAVLGADKRVCDSWEQCTHLGELRGFAEAGRLTQEDVFAEIGETVAGLKPGRESDGEYILVVPIGLGALDIALGRVAYDRVVANEPVATFRFFESTPTGMK